MRFADCIIKVASKDDVFSGSGGILQQAGEVFDELLLGVNELVPIACEASKIIMQEILCLLLIVEGIVTGNTVL